MPSTPAYRRLDVDERRRRLLEQGAELFSRHAYADLSMAAIAREAGISKALLYHYFPSKQAFFVATLEQQAAELAAHVDDVDPALPPPAQLAAALDAFLGWVEEHAEGYGKLLVGAATHPEVRELVEGVRQQTAERILAGIAPDPAPPAVRAAVHGWLWFMDGVLADWLEYRDLDRDALRGLLLGTLLGAVTAAGAP
ncbi:MAG: TetR/AcrR family transcriptional regulator [Solirubrobacteraceae bacterium]